MMYKRVPEKCSYNDFGCRQAWRAEACKRVNLKHPGVFSIHCTVDCFNNMDVSTKDNLNLVSEGSTGANFDSDSDIYYSCSELGSEKDSCDDTLVTVYPSVTTNAIDSPAVVKETPGLKRTDLRTAVLPAGKKAKVRTSKERQPSMLRKTKAQTRRQFSNQAVKRLESEGKRARLCVPKVQSFGKPKRNTKAKPKKPRAIPCPNRPKQEVPCSQCDKTFTLASNLARHIKYVHNATIFQCAICGSKLSSERGWEEHKKRFHNDDHQDIYCVYCGKAFTCQNGRRNHYRRGCDKDPSSQKGQND